MIEEEASKIHGYTMGYVASHKAKIKECPYYDIEEKDISENFCNALKSLMKIKGVNQTQLSEMIGISNVEVCRYIKGQRTPRLAVCVKIAKVFNVPIDYMLGVEYNEKETEDYQNGYNKGYNEGIIAGQIIEKKRIVDSLMIDISKMK